MTHRIETRAVPAILLLALLGTDAAQAFCFLKDHDRRTNYYDGRMPAIGFNPAVFRDYQYSPVPPGWYDDQATLPRRQPHEYDVRPDTGYGLQH